MLIGASHMERLGHNVYISPGLSEKEKAQCLQVVKDASISMNKLWGSVTADPVYIFCKNDNDFLKYGDYKVDGLSRLYTYASYIIISPKGISKDVVAHELCHAELFARLGYKNDARVPAWFHEGLAMVLSGEFDKEYSQFLRFKERPAVMEKFKNELNRFEESNGFYSRSKRQEYNYMRAGLEVSKWIDEKGNDGLVKLIERMNAGEDFETAYIK